MALYEITDLKPGRAILVEGAPYLILEAQFGRKSQAKPKTQTKLKDLRTGVIVQKSFMGSEKIEPAEIGFRHVQYLYRSGMEFCFMDEETFDQFALTEGLVGDAALYLTEGLELDLLVFEGKPIGVQLPVKVDLKIVETIPGVRGDTASGGGKPAKLQSGLTVNVPLFVNEGDTIRVNTETKEYVERVGQ